MRNKIISIIAALGLAFAVATPAKAWYGGWGYGGWGYGGYGYGGAAIGAMAGAALLGGVIGGAIAAQPYGYGYGYGYPAYGYGYAAPVYAAPVYAAPVYAPAYRPAPIRKQVIIKNSPGARVYEEDDIWGW